MFKNFINNFHVYLPGLALISLGILVIMTPMILVFVVAFILIFAGIFYIKAVQEAGRLNVKIRNFRNMFYTNRDFDR